MPAELECKSGLSVWMTGAKTLVKGVGVKYIQIRRYNKNNKLMARYATDVINVDRTV